MLWSQRYVVLVAAVSAVLFSAIIAARSSYDGKLIKIAKLFLLYYFENACIIVLSLIYFPNFTPRKRSYL